MRSGSSYRASTSRIAFTWAGSNYAAASVVAVIYGVLSEARNAGLNAASLEMYKAALSKKWQGQTAAVYRAFGDADVVQRDAAEEVQRVCALLRAINPRSSSATSHAASSDAADDIDRRGRRLLPLQPPRVRRPTGTPTRSRARAALPGLDRRRARRGAARLPRRDRPGRHRRVLLRGRRADPRHPDRHRHVTSSSWKAYPEEEPR